MSLRDPNAERGPAVAVIVEGAETSRPAPPPQAVRARPTPGFAAFVLAASLASGIAGGVVAIAIQQAASPAAAPDASPELGLSRASAAVVAAAAAVVPAVVVIENRSGTAGSSGSGVIIDQKRGYIVTNSHVIERARTTRASSDITVLLPDGRTVEARVLGNDPTTDVAVLQVAVPLQAEATLSRATSVPIGAPVIAIGTPGTPGAPTSLLRNTVTSGIVSATGRRIPRLDLPDVVLADLIQTDASIGPGMSGGPLVLVDTQEVVGLMTILVRGDASLGFAIPATTVLRVAERIIAEDTGT